MTISAMRDGKPRAGMRLSYKSREQNKGEALEVRNRKG